MSRHREVFEEFAEEAENRLGSSLKEFYLYGSVARGEETESSDVDVFAVVENMEQKKWLQRRGVELGVENGVPMSPIVRTEEELERIEDTSYRRTVLEEGEAYV